MAPLARIRLFLLCVLVVFACGACGTTTPAPAVLPKSMKGYELYSWQEGGEWRFTLITGTNRTKTYDEIVAPENIQSESGWVELTAAGADGILPILARLPRGESVFWIAGRVEGFALPPADMVSRIQAQCRELGLELAVVQ